MSETKDLTVFHRTQFAIKARSPNAVMKIIKNEDNPLFAFCWGAQYFYKNNKLECALIDTGFSIN